MFSNACAVKSAFVIPKAMENELYIWVYYSWESRYVDMINVLIIKRVVKPSKSLVFGYNNLKKKWFNLFNCWFFMLIFVFFLSFRVIRSKINSIFMFEYIY